MSRTRFSRYIVTGADFVAEVLGHTPEQAIKAAGLSQARQTKRGKAGGMVLSWTGPEVPQKPTPGQPWKVYRRGNTAQPLTDWMNDGRITAVLHWQSELGTGAPEARANELCRDQQHVVLRGRERTAEAVT